MYIGTKGESVSSLFSPKAPSSNNATINNSSLSSARGSSLLGGRSSSSATRRMPAMPVASTMTTGNMSPYKSKLDPLPPVSPMEARLTKNPLEGSYEKEMNRRGLLSTLLGREPKDATAIFRRNSLSNLIGG